MFTGVATQMFLLMDVGRDINIEIRKAELILSEIRSLKHEF
jgi:hypothetical protein